MLVLLLVLLYYVVKCVGNYILGEFIGFGVMLCVYKVVD